MQKDFDSWNDIKKTIEERDPVFCNAREIWWCSLGINVGTETNGKSGFFERPVLVLRAYGIESLFVIPLTSKAKDDSFHMRVTYEGREGWIILSHARTINSRRLQRKICRLDDMQFQVVMKRFFDLICL